MAEGISSVKPSTSFTSYVRPANVWNTSTTEYSNNAFQGLPESSRWEAAKEGALGRLQNRRLQRNYRKGLKRRLEDLEKAKHIDYTQETINTTLGEGISKGVPSHDVIPTSTSSDVGPKISSGQTPDNNFLCRNTLRVMGIPSDVSGDELSVICIGLCGFKRLCWRAKKNGPTCLIEFEDVDSAAKALEHLKTIPLLNSIKGGIRISYSEYSFIPHSQQTHDYQLSNNEDAISSTSFITPNSSSTTTLHSADTRLPAKTPAHFREEQYKKPQHQTSDSESARTRSKMPASEGVPQLVTTTKVVRNRHFDFPASLRPRFAMQGVGFLVLITLIIGSITAITMSIASFEEVCSVFLCALYPTLLYRPSINNASFHHKLKTPTWSEASDNDKEYFKYLELMTIYYYPVTIIATTFSIPTPNMSLESNWISFRMAVPFAPLIIYPISSIIRGALHYIIGAISGKGLYPRTKGPFCFILPVNLGRIVVFLYPGLTALLHISGAFRWISSYGHSFRVASEAGIAVWCALLTFWSYSSVLRMCFFRNTARRTWGCSVEIVNATKIRAIILRSTSGTISFRWRTCAARVACSQKHPAMHQRPDPLSSSLQYQIEQHMDFLEVDTACKELARPPIQQAKQITKEGDDQSLQYETDSMFANIPQIKNKFHPDSRQMMIQGDGSSSKVISTASNANVASTVTNIAVDSSPSLITTHAPTWVPRVDEWNQPAFEARPSSIQDQEKGAIDNNNRNQNLPLHPIGNSTAIDADVLLHNSMKGLVVRDGAPSSSDDHQEMMGSQSRVNGSPGRSQKHRYIKKISGKAEALFSFSIENNSELPLQQGQIIHIVSPQRHGWLVARDIQTGRSGLVPRKYVRLLGKEERIVKIQRKSAGKSQQERDHQTLESVQIRSSPYAKKMQREVRREQIETPEQNFVEEIHDNLQSVRVERADLHERKSDTTEISTQSRMSEPKDDASTTLFSCMVDHCDTCYNRVLSQHSTIVGDNWEQVRDQLPEAWKWDVEFHGDCWTCTPIETDIPKGYPLRIGQAPVVLHVEYQWPPMAGVNPPPDPKPSTPIDYRKEVPLEVLRDMFLTFEGSLGFYVLISGLLQIIVHEDFDTTWASSHLPHKYGGLKVCYIPQTLDPTMLPSKTETKKTKETLSSQNTTFSSIFRPMRISNASLNPTLKLNDFIEARPKSNHKKEKYSGKIGLKVTQDEHPYLLMSSHVITEAILAKSHRETLFGRNRPRLDKLSGDWNEHVEIWAGNEMIGNIEKTFDTAADIYPNGFHHDVTLVKPTTPAAVKDIASPIPNLGWLTHDSWASLRQQTSAVKILGSSEDRHNAKTLKCHRPSDILVIGEGIFLNQTAAVGGAKSLKDHDMSTWKNLISRALLYRVYPDFDLPNGHSGTALYADGMREDGSEGPGIVGFQSFVQRSGHVQSFEMEGPALERRLQLGRVAFYGAFEVPAELKEYDIV